MRSVIRVLLVLALLITLSSTVSSLGLFNEVTVYDFNTETKINVQAESDSSLSVREVLVVFSIDGQQIIATYVMVVIVDTDFEVDMDLNKEALFITGFT